MKLKFKNQPFQTDAVNAVVDLFKGQENSRATFSIEKYSKQLALESEFGIGNAIRIDRETLQKNMHAVQKRNNLPMTQLEKDTFPQFSVEMETGTGKTFVYTKTIYELNKQYGFTKFVIMVPSVAIREGVKNSLQTTADHFEIGRAHV